MTPNILENISTWLVDWSLLTIMNNTTPPPRDPNDDNDEDDEDDKDDKDDKDDDEDDENDDDDERQDEPAIVRESDE
jgi:hypothetical protein